MSAADAQAEPTMEEILASIRRIISEDDTGAPADAAPAAAAEPDFGDEVLELNEPVMEMPETVSPDFDFDALPVEDEPEVALEEIIVEDRWEEPAPTPAPAPAPAMAAAPAPAPVYTPPPQPAAPAFPFDQGLVSDPIADKASTVFQKLAPNTTLPGVFISGNTVEAMVGELIKPMLKDWLDANLPRIVEEKVEAEVARIARRSF